MLIDVIILIAIGVILVFIEIFIIPSFGPIGIIGGILMIAGVVLAGYRNGIQSALVYGSITFLMTIILCVVGFWLIPKTNLGKSFVLHTSEHKEHGFSSSSDEFQNLVGKTGKVITPLRPAGTILIEKDRFDVLTKGEFVKKGSVVEVVKVEGNRIIVRETSS
jgi:membrane-bound serine protease (ClpP class)